MDETVVMRSLEALLATESEETAEGFLLASVYCVCLRTGTSPRDIAENLYKALPATQNWPPLRDAILAALDQ